MQNAMKITRILIMSSLAAGLTLAACSCEKEVTFHRDDIEAQLQMNAQMCVGDTVHAVYLAVSRDVRIENISSGSVTCFINGEKAADGVQDNSPDQTFFKEGSAAVGGLAPSYARQTRFTFKADFHPGDIVRIEATANGGACKAYSEVTVPYAPAISIADTVCQQNPAVNYSDKVYRIKIQGQDIKGENSFYRLTADYERKDDLYCDWDWVSEDERHLVNRRSDGLRIDKGNDPILQDGAPAEDVDLTGASENIYNVFSDRLFKDGSFSIVFSVDPDFVQMPTGYAYQYAESDITFNARVWGISEGEYNYLKALSIYDYTGGDATFTEPVSFPDNVEGGVGFVSISTPSTASVKFTRHFSLDDNIYTGD